MKISSIISNINELKPNIYTPSTKLDWINHVEGAAWNEVFKYLAPVDISRVSGQASYDLPARVTFDRIAKVFVDGEEMYPIDYSMFETTGYYRDSNNRLAIYPIPDSNDTTPGLRVVYRTPFTPHGSIDEDVLIPSPYDKLYWQYISAMIDWFNNEYENYNNSIGLYNTSFQEFKDWYEKQGESR